MRAAKVCASVVLADAMKLPFDDASFDCVTIAFGLRNLENCSAALTEMRRVLNAKGHLLVLEFSLPTNSDLARGVSLLFASLSAVARLISNTKEERL